MVDRPTPHGICTSSKKDPTLFDDVCVYYCRTYYKADGLLIRAGTNNWVNSAPFGVELGFQPPHTAHAHDYLFPLYM